MATNSNGFENEYGQPTIAAIAADHALADMLPLETLVRLRRELRYLDADIEAAIALRGMAPVAPAPAPDADRYLTMAEVAERTGLSLSHVYELARFGKIPAKRLGRGEKGRAYRVLLSDLKVWERDQNLVADAMKRSLDSVTRNGLRRA